MAKVLIELPVLPSVHNASLPDLVSESGQAVKNGLVDAVGFGQLGAFNGIAGTEQTSSGATVLKNLRGYLVSNFRQILSQAYVEIGLIQTIVDVPVDDALRGGIEIKSKQLDESQIKDLMIALDRDSDIINVGQAAKWTRLFGGGGLIVMSDQDPETELDVATLAQEDSIEFHAVDLWELFHSMQNIDGDRSAILVEDKFKHYNYYGNKLHKSRVMTMKSITAPSFLRPMLRGWGVSVVEILIRSINQYLKATDLGFEVLDEFKLDVYKIKNLVNTLLSPNGDEKIKKRIQVSNWQKNYQNAIVMDSEDDFDHKQLSFAGLAEAMTGIRMQVAADMRMPITKLFGQSVSSGGLGNGDQNDMENYNSMVESQIRSKLKSPLLQVCEIKCQVLFGMVPDDLEIEFKPLRVLSAEQEENVKTQKFARLFQAKQGGEITTLEFRDSCNKGNLFDVTLDTTEDSLNPDDPQIEAIVTDDGEPDETELGSENGMGKAKPKDKENKNETGITTLTHKIKTVILPKAYTGMDRARRAVQNSAEFDRASYEADGGDGWIDPRRAPIFENPLNVDKGLWEKAKQMGREALGGERWQFTVWAYKKLGGHFS